MMEDLTKRENQIAGLAFCGLAKKEMADKLGTAYGTINVILDRAYKKTGTSKLNELGAWWVNRAFALNIDWQLLEKSILSSDNKMSFITKSFDKNNVSQQVIGNSNILLGGNNKGNITSSEIDNILREIKRLKDEINSKNKLLEEKERLINVLMNK